MLNGKLMLLGIVEKFTFSFQSKIKLSSYKQSYVGETVQNA